MGLGTEERSGEKRKENQSWLALGGKAPVLH